MGWLTTSAWRRISRPLDLADENDVALGTFRGVLRAQPERELEGGALAYDALVIFRKADLDSAGVTLRAMLRLTDPKLGSEFTVESTRYAFGPGGLAVVKAELSGLQ